MLSIATLNLSIKSALQLYHYNNLSLIEIKKVVSELYLFYQPLSPNLVLPIWLSVCGFN